MDALQHAFLAPTVVVVADGGIGRKVGGQVAPRAAHLHQVEDGVEDDAGMVFGFASEGALGDEGADALPLGVGEVAGVASGARGALWSLCQSAFFGSHRGVIPQNLLPVHALRRGVYCDLAEVSTIRFYRNQHGEVVLVINGGDAHDSYNAYLVFRGGDLVRRRVESGEFPQNFYEETRYVNIPVED